MERHILGVQKNGLKDTCVNSARRLSKNPGERREGGSPFAVQSYPAACTAGTERFLRWKISFSRAKIVSLQFPRSKIRRILAETD